MHIGTYYNQTPTGQKERHKSPGFVFPPGKTVPGLIFLRKWLWNEMFIDFNIFWCFQIKELFCLWNCWNICANSKWETRLITQWEILYWGRFPYGRKRGPGYFFLGEILYWGRLSYGRKREVDFLMGRKRGQGYYSYKPGWGQRKITLRYVMYSLYSSLLGLGFRLNARGKKCRFQYITQTYQIKHANIQTNYPH